MSGSTTVPANWATWSGPRITQPLGQKLSKPAASVELFGSSKPLRFVVPDELLLASSPAIHTQEFQPSGTTVRSGMIQECSSDPLPDELPGCEKHINVEIVFINFWSVRR